MTARDLFLIGFTAESEAAMLIDRQYWSQKKQLTADERRYTPRNQKLEQNTGLTHKVINFFDVSPGFIGVHPLFSAVNCRLKIDERKVNHREGAWRYRHGVHACGDCLWM
ncbi:MAG: hypothetical protein V1791_10090 [Pseudomonadota bacterium]